MEDGEWRVELRGWRVEDGGWGMEDGRWVEGGEWKMKGRE